MGFADVDGDGIDDHIKCPSCGTIFMPDSVFCRQCGCARVEGTGTGGMHGMTHEDIGKAVANIHAMLTEAIANDDFDKAKTLQKDIDALAQATESLRQAEKEAADYARLQAMSPKKREAEMARLAKVRGGFVDADGDGIDDRIKCNKCGNIYLHDSIFCRRCGNSVSGV